MASIFTSRSRRRPSIGAESSGEIHGIRQFVDWHHRALVGVDRESGVALWEFPLAQYTSNQNMPTPTFHNGRILLGGENRGIYCLQPELWDGKWSVKQRWFQGDVALDMSTAVSNADLLFGFSHYNAILIKDRTSLTRWSLE